MGSAPPAQATAHGMNGRIASRRYRDVAKTTSAIPDGQGVIHAGYEAETTVR
jgi:hypothetical protein